MSSICRSPVCHTVTQSSRLLFVLFISDNLLIRIQIFSKSFFSSSHSYMSSFFFRCVPASSVNHVDLIPVGNAVKAACGTQWRRQFALESCQLLSCQTVGTGYSGTLAGCDTWLQRKAERRGVTSLFSLRARVRHQVPRQCTATQNFQEAVDTTVLLAAHFQHPHSALLGNVSKNACVHIHNLPCTHTNSSSDGLSDKEEAAGGS